jgi:hypothetical protein
VGVLFVFEHGLKHNPVGDVPFLRVAVESNGKMSLEDVDEQDEVSQRGEALLLPQDLASVKELLDPDKLKTLGHALGHGPAWGRVRYGTGLRSSIVLLHNTPPGVLSVDSVRGVAKAAQPMLFTLLSLFAIVGQSSDEPTQRRGLALPKADQPIRMSSPHGTLLMRYHESTGADRWLKIFDTGVVERRKNASEESDGKADGQIVTIGTGAVAELYELVRRHLPKSAPTQNEDLALWELYDKNGKRELRSAALNGRGPFSSPAQRAAAKDALKAFGELYQKAPKNAK